MYRRCVRRAEAALFFFSEKRLVRLSSTRTHARVVYASRRDCRPRTARRSSTRRASSRCARALPFSRFSSSSWSPRAARRRSSVSVSRDLPVRTTPPGRRVPARGHARANARTTRPTPRSTRAGSSASPRTSSPSSWRRSRRRNARAGTVRARPRRSRPRRRRGRARAPPCGSRAARAGRSGLARADSGDSDEADRARTRYPTIPGIARTNWTTTKKRRAPAG